MTDFLVKIKKMTKMIHRLILIFIPVFFAAAFSNAAAAGDANTPDQSAGPQTDLSSTVPPVEYQAGTTDINKPFCRVAEKPEPETPPIKRLSLSELIGLVIAQNQQLQIQKADWDIRQAEEQATHGIFEPEFVTSVEHEDRRHKNTVEEALNRQGDIVYGERNWDYNFAVEGLIPTGGKINLGYNLRELSNTLTKSLTDEDDEYQMFLDISLRQPLLKNAGVKTTKSAILVAQKKSQVSFQAYRQEMMQTVSTAAATYWDFYQTQENMALIRESVRIADKILVDNRERHRAGKMAETEVLEAMAGVAVRKALLIEAQHQHQDVTNRLKTLLSLTAGEENIGFEAIDKPVTDELRLNNQAVMQRSFLLKPEYLAALENLDEADIRLSFAENQRWPELDLIASYGLNGLDFVSSEAWHQVEDGDFESWAVGLEFRVPLCGGISTKNKLKKAQLEKKQQLLLLKDIEVNLTNTIDTAIHYVVSAEERCRLTDGVVEIQKRLLDSELARLDAGKSNTRLILEREDKFRNAKELALQNRVDLQAALVELELADGTILLNHGIEIMEMEL